MSKIAYSQRDVAITGFRRRYLPVISVLLAGLLALMPFVIEAPYVPDFAFLMLIAWRLLRPELWTAGNALPLGFYNDLIAGHPLGQSMALWTMIFLMFDLIDSQLGWRDYWMDWVLAAVAILFYIYGGWYVARLMGSQALFSVMLPQIIISVLTFPLVARLVLGLDRWRLGR